MDGKVKGENPKSKDLSCIIYAFAKVYKLPKERMLDYALSSSSAGVPRCTYLKSKDFRKRLILDEGKVEI